MFGFFEDTVLEHKAKMSEARSRLAKALLYCTTVHLRTMYEVKTFTGECGCDGCMIRKTIEDALDVLE